MVRRKSELFPAKSVLHLRNGSLVAVCLLLSGLLAQSAKAAESQSYVIGWFSNAANSQDGDCPRRNPTVNVQFRENLALLSLSDDEIDELMNDWLTTGSLSDRLRDLMVYRGHIDGTPVNAYAHPETVRDPQLASVQGKYGYGFNLNGKVEATSFEDPVTGETGIDHQLFRALGCIEQYRGTANNDPTYWTWAWTMMKDSMPGWLMTITSDDLSIDGDVTIKFQRAMEHVTFNSNNRATADMTYRIDPDPRSHNEFAGQIKDGVISITEPGDLRLLKDSLSFPEFRLERTHLRLTPNEDGSLEGLIGGYQPWEDLYFAMAQMSLTGETMVTGDLPGTYYLLKNNADFDPHPETGENRKISAAYRFEAVPAFVVPME
jgi:hypothetical protein